jgi:predicted phosphoribosyltransferase
MMHFHNRSDAGRRLAAQLTVFAGQPDVLILALPRGGVPVAFEIACALHVPLDVWVVRKLGAPTIPELAIGAIASGGVQIVAPHITRELGLSHHQIEDIAARERMELERREKAYRGDRRPVDVARKTAIVVDDGLATGATMRAAIAALRHLHPARVVVAVPVAARAVCEQLGHEADDVVCLWTPADLDCVGQWYEDFTQTSDAEVCELLRRAEQQLQAGTAF